MAALGSVFEASAHTDKSESVDAEPIDTWQKNANGNGQLATELNSITPLS